MSKEGSFFERKVDKREFLKGFGKFAAITTIATPTLVGAAISVAENLAKQTKQPPSLSVSEIKSRLKELDLRSRQQPEKFETIALETIKLADSYFAANLSYSAGKFINNFKLLWDQDYVKQAMDEGCLNAPVYKPNNIAQTDSISSIININLSEMLYVDKKKRTLSRYPATLLFGSSLHELHHAAPPLIQPDKTDVVYPANNKSGITPTWFKGATALIYTPEFSIPGKTCFSNMYLGLEEVIVQDSTDRLLALLGGTINVETRAMVTSFQRNVIDKLFAGNHKTLLDLQQKSQPIKIIEAVGSKLGSKQQARATGEQYLLDLFSKF